MNFPYSLLWFSDREVASTKTRIETFFLRRPVALFLYREVASTKTRIETSFVPIIASIRAAHREVASTKTRIETALFQAGQK